MSEQPKTRPRELPSNAPASLAPFSYWWRAVNARTLRLDLIAALTTAVVALPQGVAYAILAGLPPEYGLYSAVVPVIIAALFGSSHHLICGPTTPLALLVFTTVSPLATPGSAEYITLTLTLTLLVGLYQLALAAARLGTLANLISHSVIVGFSAASAILIIGSQVDDALGIHFPDTQGALQTLASLGDLVHAIHLPTVAVALITIGTVLVSNVFLPRWPGLLLGMLAGSLAGYLLGGAPHGVATVGTLPSAILPLSMPDLAPQQWQPLLSGALAIALVGLVEAISIARSIAQQSQQRHNPNQEFLGQGLSNIAGSFFSSFPSSASFARSNLNFHSGAKTPLAAIMSSAIVLLAMGLLAPLAAYLPMAALAGILVFIGFRLIDVHHIRIILRTSRQETAVLLTTFFGCVFVGLDFGIYVGIILSLLLHLNRIAHPRIHQNLPEPAGNKRRFVPVSDGTHCPQLNIVSVDGSLFFGSVSHVEDALREMETQTPSQHSLLLICSSVNSIDINGAQFLAQEARRRREAGGRLYLTGVKKAVYELLERSGFLADIGPENIFPSKHTAVAGVFPRLDSDTCARCTARVFQECQPRSQ